MRTLSRAFITATLLSALAGSALAQAPAAKRPQPPRGPAVPSAALAPPASPGEGDERCLLAMALLTQDKQRAQVASLAMVFYAGRLSTRGVDVPTAVEHAKAKITSPQQVQADLQRCGPAFQAGMNGLQKTFAPPPGAQPPAGAAPPAAAAPPPAAAAPPPPAPK